MENVGETILSAVEDARRVCGGHMEIVGACLSLAGVDREGDELPFTESLSRLNWGIEVQPAVPEVHVVNDAFAALASGVLRDERHDVLEGVVLIVGTGTIAFGVRRDGETARSAGWGPAFSDCGRCDPMKLWRT